MKPGDLVSSAINLLYRGIILSREEDDYKQNDSYDQTHSVKKFETFQVFWFADRKIFKHSPQQLIPVKDVAE